MNTINNKSIVGSGIILVFMVTDRKDWPNAGPLKPQLAGSMSRVTLYRVVHLDI